MSVLMPIAAVIILGACGKNERVPEGILTKDQMVSVMIEFHIAEEKVNRMQLPHDSGAVVFDIFKEKILQQIAVEDSIFDQSFNYYIDRPKEMEQIYAAIVDSLQLREQRTPQYISR